MSRASHTLYKISLVPKCGHVGSFEVEIVLLVNVLETLYIRQTDEAKHEGKFTIRAI
jgi:hypothetical protein